MSPESTAFRLVACDVAGVPVEPLGPLPAMIADGCREGAGLYWKRGFRPPWIGYVAVADGVPVGLGAFTGPPVSGAVEIAYFILPEFECRGFATRTARELVRIAGEADPSIGVKAHTLPAESASPRVLRRLGFAWEGAIRHPEDGLVWLWRR
jgi:RimJ/RimL family protein N-acetyltransferase